ncbi:MAG: SUMF1/EgtB/PvdO family nonheme iron enzyme, partial [bacterium]|nr:SUMF1/EgtB/PvdO family nonheme iron enzyme [Candidatus Colisoma equi]
MRKSVFLVALSVLSSVFAAAPEIDQDSVSMVQGGDRKVTITYELNAAPFIVTVDIQTNANASAGKDDPGWVSIGEEHFRDVTGDVNLLIKTAGTKHIYWNPVNNFSNVVAKTCRAKVTAWAPDAPPDYLVVDLRRDNNRQATDPRVRYYVSTNAFPEADNVQDDLYRTDYMAMRLIKARGKTFRMGSPTSESGHETDETLHLVTFTNADFYAAVYPMTIGQALNFAKWFKGDDTGILDLQLDGGSGYGNTCLYQNQTVANQATSGYQTNHVAVCCKYHNARGTSDWPNGGHAVESTSLCGIMRTRTDVDFDLPTEAQWEFFARAGTSSSRYADNVNDIAWHETNNPDGLG